VGATRVGDSGGLAKLGPKPTVKNKVNFFFNNKKLLT
jgi:hypothetical protein